MPIKIKNRCCNFILLEKEIAERFKNIDELEII